MNDKYVKSTAEPNERFSMAKAESVWAGNYRMSRLCLKV